MQLNCDACRECVERFNDSTIQRSNDSTIQRSNDQAAHHETFINNKTMSTHRIMYHIFIARLWTVFAYILKCFNTCLLSQLVHDVYITLCLILLKTKVAYWILNTYCINIMTLFANRVQSINEKHYLLFRCN